MEIFKKKIRKFEILNAKHFSLWSLALSKNIYQQLQWLASSVASCRSSAVCGKLETMRASTLNAMLGMHRFTYS